MIITIKTLESMGACERQIALFRRLYPDGLEMQDNGPERQTVLDEAGRGGLDVEWWLKRTDGTGTARKWNNGRLIHARHYHDGALQDATDGTPAVREWTEDGRLTHESHYYGGRLQDTGGTAAVRDWTEDGYLIHESHYYGGRPQDVNDEIAAVRSWTESGYLIYEHHYRHTNREPAHP